MMKLRLLNRKKYVPAYLFCALLAASVLSPSLACGADFEQTLRNAESGAASAQFDLGGMYYNGEGAPQDYSEAIKWFQMAAKQGHA